MSTGPGPLPTCPICGSQRVSQGEHERNCPRYNGVDLAYRFYEHHPPLPTITSTGSHSHITAGHITAGHITASGITTSLPGTPPPTSTGSSWISGLWLDGLGAGD